MPRLVPQIRPGEYGGAQTEAGHSTQSAGRDGRPVQVTNLSLVFYSIQYSGHVIMIYFGFDQLDTVSNSRDPS